MDPFLLLIPAFYALAVFISSSNHGNVNQASCSCRFGAEDEAIHAALCEEFRRTADPALAERRSRQALAADPVHYARIRVSQGLPQTVEPVPLITSAQLRRALPGGVQVLDVRPSVELSGPLTPIPGSVFVLVDQLENQIRFTRLNKNKPLVVVCKKGLRSGCAVERLYRLGFTHVYSLSGGLQDWHGVQGG